MIRFVFLWPEETKPDARAVLERMTPDTTKDQSRTALQLIPKLAQRYAGVAGAVGFAMAVVIGLSRIDPAGPAMPRSALAYAFSALVLMLGLAAIVVLAARAATRSYRQDRAPVGAGAVDLSAPYAGLLAPFTPDDDPEQAALRVAQVRHTFDQLGMMMAINAINATLVAVTLARSINAWVLGAWLTTVLVMAALGLHARHRMQDRQSRSVPVRGSKRTVRRIALHAGFRGLLWGAAFALFFNDASPTGQLILLSVSLGMLAGGVPALAPVPAAALLFGLGIAVPTILRLAACPGVSYLVLALFGLAFSGSMAMVGLQLYRNFAGNLIARRQQEEQAATISLLLNEFETSASDWLWETDANGRLTRLPPRMIDLFGLPPQATETATLEAALSRAGGHGRLAIAERMAEKTAFRRILVRTRDTEGVGRWIALSATPKPDGGWRGIGSDITSEMAAEEEAANARRRAEQAEQRLAEAIDAVGAGFVVTDALDRIVIANKRFSRMFPAAATNTTATFEARVKAQAALWSPDVVREPPQWLTTLVDARRNDGGRVDVRLPDESWLRAEATPTFEGGVVTVLTDITDIKEQESQLADQAARLAQSNHDLQQFAAIASHDLQEPLRKIETFGSRLKRNLGDDIRPEAAAYLERMTDAASRMRRLVTDLLAFSRVSKGSASSDPVDLDALVATVVDDLAVRIEEKGAEIKIVPLGTVPGDATLLRQLFQNLVANALKFTRPDVTPRLCIEAQRVAGTGAVEIRFRDNGIGFDMAHHGKMFEIFQRLHGRGEYEGSGIGLATCRRIVEHHGGTIRAEGVPGEGATFIVTLPTSPASISAPEVSGASRPTAA